jgi:acyl-CoA thioesterase YciA
MTSDDSQQASPQGEISLRVLAMPADANPAGHIFGGWVMGRMDIAGAIHAAAYTTGHMVTVAVDAMKFHKPVHVGDEVTCYTLVERTGRTSITMQVETWVRRRHSAHPVKVTEGRFTYVAVDDGGTPIALLKK